MRQHGARRRSCRPALHRSVIAACEPLERRVLLDAVPVGPEFRVNSSTTTEHVLPVVGIDADGAFVVAWQSEGLDGPGSRGIHAQRFNSAGVPQGGQFQVNTFTTGHQGGPAIGMDASGDFVVTWGSAGQGNGVYAQRYNSAGVAQGGEFRINPLTEFGDAPTVAMDADGDFVVAWGDPQGEISAQRYNPAGVTQGGVFRVNTYTTNLQRFPVAAMDADGDFVVTWESYTQEGPGPNWGIYAQRYNSSGVAQGAELHVNTYTPGNQRIPAVAMDATGDFVVTWLSYDQEGPGTEIYLQRYNAAGVAQGAESRVNTYTTSFQIFPTVAMDADGDFVVTWMSNTDIDLALGVFAQHYDAAGLPQGEEFHVNTYTTNNQRDPSVAMDADGDFVVTWQSQQTGGGTYGVYAQRLSVAPSVMSSSFLFATLPQRLTFTFNRDVSASLTLDDVVVQSLPTGSLVAPSGLTYDTGTNTATITFKTPVPDGNLRATLLGAGVTSTVGVPMAADYYSHFFFLRGDANHDGRVNLNDFNILAANFGQSPRDFTQGDFDYNNIVNLNDFNLLAARFGVALPALAAPVGGEFRVNTTTLGPQTRGNIASDAAGNSVLVWASVGQGGDFASVYGQRYDPNGVPQGSEFKVNTTVSATTTLSAVPRVGMADDGDFVVVWGSLLFNTAFATYGVRGQRFNASGVPQGSEFLVSAVSQPTGQPFVASDEDGDFAVVWESYVGVEARRYNAAGVSQGASFIVSAATTTQFGRVPRVSMDDSGDFVVAWNTYDASSQPLGVNARRYNAVGAALGAEFQVSNGGGAAVAVDADGDFVVSYSASRPGDTLGVFARRYDAAGTPQGVEIQLNQYTTDAQLQPSISSDSNGNFLVSWVSFGQDGAAGGIMARVFAASGQPLTDEFRVNTYTTGNQSGSSTLLEDDGDIIVRWSSDAQDGSLTGVYAQRFSTLPPLTFGARGDEFRINTFTTGNQALPRMAMDADGNFVVVWHSFGQDAPGSYGVYAQRYSAAGVAQGGEFRVNTTTSGAQSSPSVAMDADGDFVVVWMSYGQDSLDSFGVYSQRYNSAGASQGGEFRVNSYTTDFQGSPAVAMDSSGAFVIAWQSTGQDGSLDGVYAQRYDAAGVAQGIEFRANSHTPNKQQFPALAMDASGDFVVTWASLGQDGSNYGVYAQRYNAAAVPQGGEFRVNTFTTSNQKAPSVAVDADGDFVVTWQSPQDGSDYGVYAQRYNAVGAVQGSEFKVNTHTTSFQTGPRVAMDADGDFVIAWQSSFQDGSAYGVYAQRYNAAGVAQSGEFNVNAYTTSSQRLPTVAMDSAGDFVIAWQSSLQDGSGYGVYSQRYATALASRSSPTGFWHRDEPLFSRKSITDDPSDLIEDLLLNV